MPADSLIAALIGDGVGYAHQINDGFTRVLTESIYNKILFITDHDDFAGGHHFLKAFYDEMLKVGYSVFNELLVGSRQLGKSYISVIDSQEVALAQQGFSRKTIGLLRRSSVSRLEA
jgi:hypothetical protein